MVVLAVLAVVDLLRIRADVAAGSDQLTGLTLERAADEDIERLTAAAAARLQRAADRSRSSPWLSLLEPLPVAGDQVRGVRRLAGAAGELGVIARETGRVIAGRLEVAGTPRGRLVLLDTVLRELDRIERAVAQVDVGTGSGLLGPLADAHQDIESELARLPARLSEARGDLTAVRALLAGPTRMAVLAGNNAEMTAGAGMPLSIGIAEIHDGDIAIGDFVGSGRLLLAEDPVRPPGDLGRIYQPMALGRDLRGATATPNFPVAGQVVQAMALRAGLGRVDGVVLVDAVALRHLLDVIGPIEVGGLVINASNVEAEVLHRNYLRFETHRERSGRIELQSEIAHAAFDALQERDVELASLAAAMQRAAAGRHLLAWSADPVTQGLWADLGASGELRAAGLLVSTQNYDGNKLDWFLRPELDIATSIGPQGQRLVEVTVTLAYPELPAASLSPTILGPTPRTHFAFVDFHLPGAARDIRTDHPEGFWTQGADPPMQARTILLRVDRGTTEQRTVSFALPLDVASLVLLPSARIEPMPVTVNGVHRIVDDTARLLPLEARPTRDGAAPPTAVRVLVVAGASLAWLAAASLHVHLLRQRRLARQPVRPVGAQPFAALYAAQLFALLALATFMVTAVTALLLADLPR